MATVFKQANEFYVELDTMKRLHLHQFILLISGCCLSLCSLAQAPKQSLRIQLSYQRPGQYLEQAIETIEAVNTINRDATVEYRAGRSVTLQPGFEAQTGSTFTAAIKPVAAGEGAMQLAASPNPFEQTTTIEYYLPAEGTVNLWITDAQGKVVGQLVQGENQSAGHHKIDWKPTAITSGVYMPILEANQQKAVSRLIKK